MSLRVGGKVPVASAVQAPPSAEDRQDSSHPPERRISTVSALTMAETGPQRL